MKLAIVYNRDSQKVINIFGVPNQEKIGIATVRRIEKSLREGGHQVRSFEGDKELISRLEDYMPKVVKGEIPGLVFNISYGIQGQARYTHVPSILEMVGVPYIGSGPLAHSLSLDKVVAKMIFREHGLPTPDFAVLDAPGFPEPEMGYPLIVKPKNEAVSFGLKIVNSEEELREAAGAIFDVFRQTVLVERYIEGREINVGLIGNEPIEAFPPVELLFGDSGPRIYTMEDKKRLSGREISFRCPAEISDEKSRESKDLAVGAFRALGCSDCARIDMRMDAEGKLHILEVNSLPSLGEHGSYLVGAAAAGMDFTAVVNRLVEEASARYFGTPRPARVTNIGSNDVNQIFSYITSRRDRMEKSIEEWTGIRSRTDDPVGLMEASRKLDSKFREIGMVPVREFTDEPEMWTWSTRKGLENGTLLIGHLDVPTGPDVSYQSFRRDAEWLFGEGIATSRAPLVMLEYVLRALKSARKLHNRPIGVLYYTDEGRACLYSAEKIKKITSQVKRVFVLRPGNFPNNVIIQRRGLRKYVLTVEGPSFRLGQVHKKPEVFNWVIGKLSQVAKLSSRKDHYAITTSDIRTDSFPMRLPHRVTANLLLNYLDRSQADRVEKQIRDLFSGEEFKPHLEMIYERPAMKERKVNNRLASQLAQIGKEWDIPVKPESSLLPSVAGLVPGSTPVVCGVGPVAKDLYTPGEMVQRISVTQRALLLAQYLEEK